MIPPLLHPTPTSNFSISTSTICPSYFHAPQPHKCLGICHTTSIGTIRTLPLPQLSRLENQTIPARWHFSDHQSIKLQEEIISRYIETQSDNISSKLSFHSSKKTNSALLPTYAECKSVGDSISQSGWMSHDNVTKPGILSYCFLKKEEN